jgi:predicted RNA binding protein YcfA (HicA-like mRNA interferase family)
MPPVPLLRPGEIVAVFEKLDWRVARRHGSHIILTKAGHISTLSVPNHPQVACGTLRILVARAGLTIEDFLATLG